MFGSCFRTLAVILVSGSFVVLFVLFLFFVVVVLGGTFATLVFQMKPIQIWPRGYRVYSISRFVCACGILFFCLFVCCLFVAVVCFVF